MNNVSFPNAMIDRNWYASYKNGHKINRLRFIGGQLLIINEKAFSAHEFSQLHVLIFENIATIKCLGGWLSAEINQLEFHHAVITEPPYDFMRHASVYSFVMNASFGGGSDLANLFELAGRQDTSYVHIQDTQAIKRIGAMQLLRLRRVRTLILVNCGIEIIGANAFVTTRHLEILDLSDNQLITLPTNLFTELLLQRTFVELRLNHNKWQCYCDLLHVKQQLAAYSITFDELPENCSLTNSAYHHNAPANINNNGKINCRPTIMNQHVNRYKTCIMDNELRMLYLNYPRFKLKMNIHEFGRMILMNTSVSSWASITPLPFYAFIEHHSYQHNQQPHHRRYRYDYHRYYMDMDFGYQSKNRCALNQPIVCYKFTQPSNVIPPGENDFIDLAQLQRWCMLDGRLNAWPYNCISICNECHIIGLSNVWLRIPSLTLAIVTGCLFAILATAIGIGLGVLLLRVKPKLLHGVDRVIFLENKSRNRRDSYTIFIMPKGWRNEMQNFRRP